MTDARTREGHPRLVVFAIVALVLAGVAVVVARPFGDQRADLSSYPTGITAAGLSRARSLAENSNVPAAIMAAVPQAYGADPAQQARLYTPAQQSATIQNNTPIGPYQLVYNDVYAFAKAYKILPLSFKEMADPQHSGNWLVGAVAAVIHGKRYPASAVNFTAGTTDQPYFNPGTNNVDQRTLIRTATGSSARATARRSWIAILSALPISGVGSRAAAIYNSAFHWTVVGSLSQVCGGVPTTYANIGVIPAAGSWANPVPSSKILTPFGETHDGVDLAAPAGAPVYAATNGVVKFVGSDAGVAAVGGARALVLYTGNGLTFAYQDLGTDAVTDGQQVKVGQLLGTVAAAPTDHPSSGPHLHFGVNTVHAYATNQPTWVDPVSFMNARRVSLGTSAAGAPVAVPRSATTSVRTTEGASSTRGLMDLWQRSQLSVAATIISTGQQFRVPAWGIQTALMTAMHGSRLGTELPSRYGSPRGVLGLPASWGSVTARSDVAQASQMFYARLVKVAKWQTLKPWDAASRTGAYAAASTESYRAMWSGAGILMNVLGAQGTTSTYGTDATVGGGCTGAPVAGGPTVNLSGGFKVASFNLHGCTASGTTGADSCTGRFPPQWTYINQHGFSIVGLQELEPAVTQLLQGKVNASGSHWAFYPTSPQYVHQQTTAVLWRTDQWHMLSTSVFQIPKYAWTDCSTGKPITHTTPANETQVLLRNAAGQKVWVISIHNISTMDAAANAQNCRPSPPNPSFAAYLSKLFPYMLGKDMGVEAPQVANAYKSGIPVVVIADFNDDTVLPICTIQRLVPSAHSIWDPIPAGGCGKPASTKGQPYEKIIGSGGLTFSQSRMDWTTQTTGMTYGGKVRGITDHGVPSVLATLP